jgi:2-oxoisovalerate dehydrogenase E1 component alpha subunit
MVAAKLQEDLRRVLDDDGKVLSGATVPEIPDEDLLLLFEKMLLVRIVDDRMMRLQRQGRLGFYMKSIGEEASHFAVYPLRDTDWVYPSYREQGSWFWRGYTVKQFIDQLWGNSDDPVKGRQMPVHHSARWLNLVSISSPVGTQIPQAVGTAMAMKISGSDDAVMTYFGEGTSSTGDFHVALNFAGVHKAPVVFVCRNNGWAISVPREKQTASRSFAAKAVGYGMPGVRVDGNDILAVIQVTREALERARAGDGPTLIEAKTYRIEGHSSSDDPSVYRKAGEPEQWSKRDPLDRFRSYLKSCGLYSDSLEAELSEKHNDEISAAVDAANKLGPPAVETLFDDVYETMPWNLEEQKRYLMAQPRTKSSHSH